jgi:hypothetical protein
MHQQESAAIVICEHLYGTWGRVQCHNQLQLDFGAFTCKILGSNAARLLFTAHMQNGMLSQKTIRISTGRQPGANMYSI